MGYSCLERWGIGRLLFRGLMALRMFGGWRLLYSQNAPKYEHMMYGIGTEYIYSIVRIIFTIAHFHPVPDPIWVKKQIDG